MWEQAYDERKSGLEIVHILQSCTKHAFEKSPERNTLK